MTISQKYIGRLVLLGTFLLSASLQAAFPAPNKPTVMITGANASRMGLIEGQRHVFEVHPRRSRVAGSRALLGEGESLRAGVL